MNNEWSIYVFFIFVYYLRIFYWYDHIYSLYLYLVKMRTKKKHLINLLVFNLKTANSLWNLFLLDCWLHKSNSCDTLWTILKIFENTYWLQNVSCNLYFQYWRILENQTHPDYKSYFPQIPMALILSFQRKRNKGDKTYIWKKIMFTVVLLIDIGFYKRVNILRFWEISLLQQVHAQQ